MMIRVMQQIVLKCVDEQWTCVPLHVWHGCMLCKIRVRLCERACPPRVIVLLLLGEIESAVLSTVGLPLSDIDAHICT